MPQPPQLPLSVCVLTHAPLQNESPAVGHAQAPFMHVAPPEPLHVAPQLPQFVLSVFVLTHEPLQSVRPAAHMLAHVPMLHTTVAPVAPEHVRPQPPQLVRLDAVSTHLPLQRAGIVPLLHPHLPLLHCSPLGHAVPHDPQLFVSVWVLTHARLQSVRAAPHVL
jgi:hypothetical protein